MQHRDDDMEELFQRAGKDYQLRESKSGWQNIFERISHDNSTTTGATFYQKSRRIIHGSLPLLFAFVLFTLLPKPLENCLLLLRQTTTTKNAVNPTSLTSAAEIKLKNSPQGAGNDNGAFFTSGLHRTMEKVSEKAKRKTWTQGNNKKSFLTETYSHPDENNMPVSDYALAIPQIRVESINRRLLLENKDKVDTNKINTSQRSSKDSKKKTGLFVGIAGAFEASKVGTMAPDKPRLAAGIVLGYPLNTRLSVESGLLVNTKKYKSKGSDFSLDKIGSTMPGGMIINDLESRTTIIEVPLKFKYNIFRRPDANVFVTGGLSAYIVTKEKNRYNVSTNGIAEMMTGDYEKNNYKMPAIANLSIGYEYMVSRYLHLRMESFLKIPLQGIGVGNLRVTSAGLQMGIIAQPK